MKRFSEVYDAYYDDVLDVWLEPHCSNPKCEFCSERPSKPSLAVRK